jgi:hypothetical protein
VPVGCGTSPLPRYAPDSQTVYARPGVDQRDVHVLALAGEPALHLRREDRVDGGGAGGDVVDRDADLDRLAPGLTRHAQEAGDALGHDVEPGPVAVRPGLAEAADGAVQQVLADLLERLVPDPQPRGHAGPEVLDDEVGALGELDEQLAPAVGLEVQRDAPLAAVRHRERVALTVDLRCHPAGVVTRARLLDLDDVGPELGQDHRAVRTGQEARQVEDAESVEGFHVCEPSRIVGQSPVLWEA